MLSKIILASILVASVSAQQQPWGQCGGQGWTGPTTCVSGWTCVYNNQWYSQCLQGQAASSTPRPASSTNRPPSTTVRPPTSTSATGRRPTLYLAGDSTTANDEGTAYRGWGYQIGKYLSITAVNNAVPGKSSRSFTTQGYFSSMYNNVRAGDIVVIEFGHNEGGGPQGNPQQGVCPGTSLTTTCNDNGTTVYTYHKYMTDAINNFKQRGVSVIVASQTPRNIFRDSSGTPVYVGYAQDVAASTSVTYVNHYSLTVTRYNQLGSGTVNGYYPQDNIHTNAAGADVVAAAFVRGVLCNTSNPLYSYISNTNVQPTTCP